MTAIDYVESVIGVPWVFAGKDYDGMDCAGLLEHSFIILDGIQLPHMVPRDDVNGAFVNADWLTPCEWKEGAVFTLSDDDGNMHHVGRVLAGQAVHAHGKRGKGGQVKVHTKGQLIRMFGADKIHTFEVSL